MAAVRTLDLDAFQNGSQQCNEAAAEIRDSVKSFNVLLHILSLLKSLRAEETQVTTWVPLFFFCRNVAKEVDGLKVSKHRPLEKVVLAGCGFEAGDNSFFMSTLHTWHKRVTGLTFELTDHFLEDCSLKKCPLRHL